MNIDEMKEKAKAEVVKDNRDSTSFDASTVYEHFLDGTLITVAFENPDGRQDSNHVYFDGDQMRVYRLFNQVFNLVSRHRERRWFFRFLEFAGVGGLIAFTLIVIFSVLLCVLALKGEGETVVEVVKLSFTIVLGYFFGSQTTGKK